MSASDIELLDMHSRLSCALERAEKAEAYAQRLVEDYDRQAAQLKLCEEHAGTMARDFDASLAVVKAERDKALDFANKVERGEVSFAKKCDEQLVIIAALPLGKTGNENLSDAVRRVLGERDEARAKMAQFRAAFETAAAKADQFYRERDALRALLTELLGWVPFLMHQPTCHKWKVAAGECSCGLAAFQAHLHAALRPVAGLKS